MRQPGRSSSWQRRVGAAWLVCVLLLTDSVALAQDRVQLNVITKIEVKGGTVEVTGSRRPSFTTFTLTDPPRLVIDISEAVFQGVPAETKVNDGSITVVKVASYGSESAAIARVLIGFEQELESDIVTVGSSLVVKLPQNPKELARLAQEKAQAERQARATAEAAERDRLAREKAEADARARAEKEEQERVARAQKEEAERLAKEEAEKKAKAAEEARLAKLEAERVKKEAEEAKRRELEAAKKKAEEERLAKLEAERL
ncbi:MAG: AMIN domain-containing protein, partial [Myxococcaceae bacterium]